MNTQTVYVGIDVSKENLDLAVNPREHIRRFHNTATGIGKKSLCRLSIVSLMSMRLLRLSFVNGIWSTFQYLKIFVLR